MAGTATGNAIQSATGASTLANPVTVAQGGTGQTTANAGFNALSPLTTAGDLIIENGTPVAARLPVGTAVQMLGVSGGLPAWTSALTLVASTGTTPYTLVNGTGNIITWTAPNDGGLHYVKIGVIMFVTSGTTGGQIGVNSYLLPNGTAAGATNILSATQGPGIHGNTQAGLTEAFVQANTAIIVQQQTAMTAGAAVLWAVMWAN